ncbi:unnamed protein product [Lepeophtheirus salmonis]|uniref:(salmon louse) hypothetical protein n=1 Tax=Lepeophtheirus salmonis TaxID=72036 RepID=A0A7R8H968_LEPSM|nr:unnamed protein product [Lepeophtheirus salmonis]CAF2936136.1 unnamed protein product [Lepeophtheirus salmonis]
MRTSVLLVMLLVSACESYLQGGDVTCHADSEGRIVQVNGITDITPCIQCKCSGGVVKCLDRSKTCPSIRGCYNIVPTRDKCCPFKCKDCNVIRKSHGSLWVEGTMVHQCYAGIVTKSHLSSLSHPNSSIPSEYSRKQCKTDQNQILFSYQTLPDPRDPCSTCICLPSGLLHCFTRVCPVLDCPLRLIVRKPSRCCPECNRHRDNLSIPNTTCLFQGKAYPLGSPLVDISCPNSTNCSCQKGLPICERNSCQTLTKCPPGTKRMPGKCCPECQSVIHSLGRILKGYKSSETCLSNQKTYADGQTWKRTECVSCSCSKGEVKCETETCDAVCPPGHERVRKERSESECCEWECKPLNGICTVFGDPHFRTFDDRLYTYQGSCKYLLTQECDPFTGTPQKNASFSIRVTNDARDTHAFSWTRTVTVRIPGVKVSLLQRMKVKINGKKVSLPYIKLGTLSVMQDEERIVLRTHEGVRLLWDGISFLEVALPPKFRNRVCGLCGNFNGDKVDDFYGPSGKQIHNKQEFGESWRVGGLKSCSRGPSKSTTAPSCSQNWGSKIKSDRNCNAFRSPLFQTCRSHIPYDYYFNACKLDMCECPGNQCHCEVLTAYVRECERSGILISKWREVTGCKNLSSFSYKHNSTASANLISSSSLMDDMPCTGSKCQRVSSSSNKSDIKIHRLTKVGGAFLDVIKKALTKKDFKRLERAKTATSSSKASSRKSLEGSLEKSQRMLWKSQKDTEKRRWRKNRKKNLRRPPPFESLLMEDEGINSKLIDTKNIPPALL